MSWTFDDRSSRFLTRADVETPILLTIREFSEEDVRDPKTGQLKRKRVMHFYEDVKPDVLGWEKAQSLKVAIGSANPADAIGKRVVAFLDRTARAPDGGGAIRYRAPRPKPAPEPAPAEADFDDEWPQ